ncbi:MAG TPA: sigma 54-interacting transcriptional regulator, partial [Polyangiaceae bacterium]|nr:sigma 54-interacting transcriptional regulator [Polyangiaceae bacterium]
MQLEALQALALSVAAARSPDAVLKQMVQGLGMTDGVALARVWLLRRDPGEEPFLELKASIGASLVSPDVRWNRTDGAHKKIPLSYGKVGQIAQKNQPLLLQRGSSDWLVQPAWAEEEGIESFAGQPLCFRSEVLGVVAFFSRKRLAQHDLSWLRVFADHAAVAVANARAFEEIERLKESAERERDYLRAAVRTALQQGDIVAESPAMQHVLAQAGAVAQSDSAVLITGESGVGKELIAARVHDLSRRRDGPLVKVNCASVPRELFESEFFGHVRG